MRANLIVITLIISLSTFIWAGCAQQQPSTPPNQNQNQQDTTPDTQTTTSIVNEIDAFKKAISKDGTWIICLLKDLTSEEELVLEGEFTNGKKNEEGKEIIQRKIALYEQDDNRNITKRYTLTIPKLTIKSPEASIQHGTFVGDLVVDVKNFKLVDTTVEGNVFFTSEEAKSTFQMDEQSKITGKQELQKQ